MSQSSCSRAHEQQVMYVLVNFRMNASVLNAAFCVHVRATANNSHDARHTRKMRARSTVVVVVVPKEMAHTHSGGLARKGALTERNYKVIKERHLRR